MVDLLDAFLYQVQLHPHLAAVEFQGASTSYIDLKTFASQIAFSIKETSSTVSPRVLLALPHSTTAYAGMIGTLMAGGTFCPMNIEGPEGRNAIISREFSPDVIIYESSPPTFLDNTPATTPRIEISRLATNELHCPAAEYSEIAYVVFTSGSTGQPKGVKIGRSAFSHFLTVARDYFNITHGERWGQFSNLGYDLAVMDVFLAITQGATLVPLSSPKERLMPANAIREKRIGIWQSVPSVLELMIEAKQLSADYLAPLRLMSFCGEPLLRRHLEAVFSAKQNLQVFNTYGTTETTGFNTINRLTHENYLASCDAATVALGEDVPGWTISLLNGNSADEGEIVVSSAHLSSGYWHDEERTRSVFRQMRLAGETECRSYFTGDWGILRNSRLYFSCRVDRQVKIRGERIELDEVDYLLREAGFPAAYTLIKGDELHSFVESIANVDVTLVRNQLAKRLPFHSIPKGIHAIPSLPRNPNGKVDRVALEQILIP